MANVGDSRGVLCDKNGNAVPLSHDHKPYQLKERKRIKKAGEKTNKTCPDHHAFAQLAESESKAEVYAIFKMYF